MSELRMRTHIQRLSVFVLAFATVSCLGTPSATTTEIAPPTIGDAPTTSAVSTTSTTAKEAVTSIPPISGYGDFSEQTYFEIDWLHVTELVIRCMNDQGIPATLTPDGAGISAEKIPPDQNQIGFETMNACMEGLSLPPQEEANPDQLAEIYQYNLALKVCLEAEGYDVPEPPSLEVYIDTYLTDPWYAYENVNSLGPEGVAIEALCPQQPVGGYGAWQPGDPVQPRPET